MDIIVVDFVEKIYFPYSGVSLYFLRWGHVMVMATALIVVSFSLWGSLKGCENWVHFLKLCSKGYLWKCIEFRLGMNDIWKDILNFNGQESLQKVWLSCQIHYVFIHVLKKKNVSLKFFRIHCKHWQRGFY